MSNLSLSYKNIFSATERALDLLEHDSAFLYVGMMKGAPIIRAEIEYIYAAIASQVNDINNLICGVIEATASPFEQCKLVLLLIRPIDPTSDARTVLSQYDVSDLAIDQIRQGLRDLIIQLQALKKDTMPSTSQARKELTIGFTITQAEVDDYEEEIGE